MSPLFRKTFKKMQAAIVYNVAKTARPEDIDTELQVELVSSCLNELEIETKLIPFGDSLGEIETELRALKPDFVFNLVETAQGTDRLLFSAAALFEFLKIPYSGCTASTLASLASKMRQKTMMNRVGIPTPFFFDGTDIKHLKASKALESNSKFISKSDNEHGSYHLWANNIFDSLQTALDHVRMKRGNDKETWFAEEYIVGREFNVSLLQSQFSGVDILPIAEMLFEGYDEHTPKIVDYAAKWEEESDNFRSTVRSFEFKENDAPLLEGLNSIAKQCWEVFELSGAARVDVRVDCKGHPWVLEVNANPCLSRGAGFLAAAEKAKLLPKDVIARLIPKGLL